MSNSNWRFAQASPGATGEQLQRNVNSPPNRRGQSIGGSTTYTLPTGNMPRALGGSYPDAGNGVPGVPNGRAQGNNPPISTRNPPGLPKLPQGPTVLGVGQESAYRGGLNFANDKLVTTDRHAYFKVGTENSGRRSGQVDPPLDGPARPSLAIINRTISYQQGSDSTRNQDDLSRDYARTSDGKLYVGEQGSGWSPVYGGVPGMYQPYGSYAGVTAGEVKGIQSPVPQGDPMDGPRKVWSGPPHGLHTQTFPDYAQTLGYYMSVPGMRPGRMNRPANSPIAGQSFSQLVLPQGATGTTTSSMRTLTGDKRILRRGWSGA